MTAHSQIPNLELTSPGMPAPCGFPGCVLDAFHAGEHDLKKPRIDFTKGQHGRTYHCVVCGRQVTMFGDPALTSIFRTCQAQSCVEHLARREAAPLGVVCCCRQRPYPHELTIHALLKQESYHPKLRHIYPWSLALSPRIEPSTERKAA